MLGGEVIKWLWKRFSLVNIFLNEEMIYIKLLAWWSLRNKYNQRKVMSCWYVWLLLDEVDPFIFNDKWCMLYDCIFMAYHDTGYFHFMLNLIITQLEHIVDRVMVPLNRVFPSATTFAFMGRPLFGPLSCI